MLPSGHRLHVVLEGISRDFSAVNIRKQAARGPSPPKASTGAGAINPALIDISTDSLTDRELTHNQSGEEGCGQIPAASVTPNGGE